MVGLNLAKATKARRIHVRSNSQLVIGQSTGSFEADEDPMKSYTKKVQDKLAELDEVQFSLILRDENERASALAIIESLLVINFSPMVYVQDLQELSINKKAVMEIQIAPCLIYPTKNSLEAGKLSKNPIKTKRIERISSNSSL